MEEYTWIESINDFIVNHFKEDPSIWTDLNSDGKNDSMCAKFEKNIFEDKENYTASHMSITKEDKPGAPEGIYIFNKKDKTYWKYTYSDSDITDKLVKQITNGYIRLLTQTYDRFAQLIFSVPLESKNWKAVANQLDDFAKTLLK